MRIKTLLLVALVAIILAGCTPTLVQVTQEREIYTATLHQLNALQNAGKITSAQHNEIEPLRAAAAKALDEAEIAARAGDKVGYQTAIDAAATALDSLVAASAKAKGN